MIAARAWGRRSPLVALAVSALLLAACGQTEPRTAVSPSDPGGHAVLTVSQAMTVVKEVDDAVLAAATSRDVAAMGLRGAEPYTTMTMAKLRVPSTDSAVAEPLSVKRLWLPEQEEWPRFFLAVGATASQTTPVLRVMTSTDARTPYALAMELTMFPGATLPDPPALDDFAAPVVPPDDASRSISPIAVLTGYADLLSKGPASAAAPTFADDVYARQILARPATDAAQLGTVATVTSLHTAVPESVVAVGVEGGGMLVVGQLQQSYTITVRPGAGTVNAPPAFATLAGGRSTFTKSLVRTSTQVVAFVVPPAGKVTAVAAQRADISVTGS